MTISNGYTTLAEFKALYSVSGTDSTRDGAIELVIEDVSRMIDDATGRRFYGAAPATARYYTAESGLHCFIDDCTTISALATDDGSLTYPYTWATTDYHTLPANTTPITYLDVKPNGAYRFPRQTNGVKVTAVWGYNLTSAGAPGPIRRACLLQANRIYERRTAPFGVVSASEVAPMTVLKLDNDVLQLIAPYVKQWGGGN